MAVDTHYKEEVTDLRSKKIFYNSQNENKFMSHRFSGPSQ